MPRSTNDACLDTPLAHGTYERLVITFILIGVASSERCNGIRKGITFP